jgi:hypothetical protein
MRIAVVATTVSYLVQLVPRSLALPMPFAACWNERERAGARRFSHSVTHPFLQRNNMMMIRRESMFQMGNGSVSPRASPELDESW